MIVDLIKDGSVARLFLIISVFGGLLFVIITGKAFDERLFDIAFVIIGFYFGTTVTKFATKATPCSETRVDIPETK